MPGMCLVGDISVVGEIVDEPFIGDDYCQLRKAATLSNMIEKMNRILGVL
jgi:hypothetical protein